MGPEYGFEYLRQLLHFSTISQCDAKTEAMCVYRELSMRLISCWSNAPTAPYWVEEGASAEAEFTLTSADFVSTSDPSDRYARTVTETLLAVPDVFIARNESEAFGPATVMEACWNEQ